MQINGAVFIITWSRKKRFVERAEPASKALHFPSTTGSVELKTLARVPFNAFQLFRSYLGKVTLKEISHLANAGVRTTDSNRFMIFPQQIWRILHSVIGSARHNKATRLVTLYSRLMN